MAKPSEPPNYPQPPILKRNGFQFRNGVLSVDSIDRIDGSRLNELFNPTTLRLKRDQKDAAEKARQLFKKPFFAAQLRYYDIPFKSSASKTELQLLLQDAVRQGKCNHVPNSVTELEASMMADYEPLQQEWEAECAVWDAAKKKRDDEAFGLCKTPSERAAFDLHRFMDMYFLTNGEPDKTKTTEVLALQRSPYSEWEVHDMARKIPGLHTRNGGFSSNSHVCIGWDDDEVSKLAKSITDRENEAMEAKKEAIWEEQLERHRKYVAKVQPEGTSNGANKDSEVFNLDRCLGSYVIRCDAISDGWLNILDGRTLTMDICRGNGNMLRAAYDFGILEGTMFLSLSEDPLKAIVGEDSTGSEASNEEENEDEEEDEEDDADPKDSTNGNKRKAGEASLEQDAGSAVDAKRRKTNPPPSGSHRVYFLLHGRETGEGEVLHFPDSGHIDFLGDGCISFAGLVYDLSHVGPNVEFRGYKVSDRPRVEPEPWSTFLYGRYGLEWN